MIDLITMRVITPITRLQLDRARIGGSARNLAGEGAGLGFAVPLCMNPNTLLVARCILSAACIVGCANETGTAGETPEPEGSGGSASASSGGKAGVAVGSGGSNWASGGSTSDAGVSGGAAGAGGSSGKPTSDAGASKPKPDAGGGGAGGTNGAGGTSGGGSAGVGGATGGGGAGCGSLSYAGKCKGSVLSWCEDGAVQTADCAAKGKTCGYQDSSVGYNCLTPASGCGTLDDKGKCDGSVLSWCEGGTKQVVDCADTNRACKWEDGTIGYNCVATNPVGQGGKLGFGYPVGDKTTYPAGGWQVSQVLGNYLYSPPFVGGHLAEDIFNPNGASANAPVYSVADGVVVYAGSNSSSYKNTVMIKHDLGNGQKVCSFYGHLWPPVVSKGQSIKRGQKIAEVMDWVYFYGTENSHLHYVIVTEALCDQALAGSGGLCGYDSSNGPTGYSNLSNEPFSYTSKGDGCGSQVHKNGYLSPAQFILANHF
ncbi:MAG: M23 family metallopeptidase [Myxococcales bacterium]|nr:M23 family metallopeptidase [Myxococcales bacterium]